MAGRRCVLALVVLATTCGLLVSAAYARRDTATSQATVKVAKSKFGQILVDGQGRSLYIFTPDTADQIECASAHYYRCSKTWRPLLTKGKPHAGPGVSSRLLGTVKRTDPSGLQVTYNGHPPYRSSFDKKAGDVVGQGFASLWYLLSPNGAAVKK
jgi:predicted lipoprotein with Yx(FWY)xxD motif